MPTIPSQRAHKHNFLPISKKLLDHWRRIDGDPTSPFQLAFQMGLVCVVLQLWVKVFFFWNLQPDREYSDGIVGLSLQSVHLFTGIAYLSRNSIILGKDWKWVVAWGVKSYRMQDEDEWSRFYEWLSYSPFNVSYLFYITRTKILKYK